MSKKLLIVESPAKAKTIGKYIGDNYKVVASVGHVRDLPKSNKKAIDIESGFIPHYEISKSKEKVVKNIKELAQDADEIILATDPDREGESIAWHLAELIKNEFANSKVKNQKSKPEIKRVTYNEITKEAIQEALEHPRDIDQNLRKAQEARRVLDRLVGYDLSGLIWKKVRYGLSAGRVQSPALRILMEREREIRAFVPETFYVINAELQKTKEGTSFEGSFTAFYEKEPKTKEEADKVYNTAKAGNWSVKDVVETEVKRAPYPPFTTSTLQQAASTRLSFSPKRTMMIAQKLYESGHITYMRTDSSHIANEALNYIKEVVIKKFGAEFHQVRHYKTKSQNAQEAHEAIRPTHFNKEIVGYSEDQKKLYKLIWQRTVASQMQDALMMRTKIIAEVDNCNFYANGSRVIRGSWLLADPRAKGEDIILPQVKLGDPLSLINLKSEEKQTEPPKRYSEAGLIKELEKRGIGRPSTYASIITTIIDRGYVEKEGRILKPTDTGDVVSTFLENNFKKYISDTFTAEMETKLDQIAEGEREYGPTLKDFYKPFSKEIKEKEETAKITTLGEADPKIKCPECGNKMVIKLGKSGKFLSCEKFPKCKGIRNLDGSEIEKAKKLGIELETGLPILVLEGRYGPYVQLGEKNETNKKPRRASIPKDKDPSTVTFEEAVKYLSLPRELGKHPKTGETISANIGRFGPYIVHQKDFRSLKKDDVYTIKLPRALEIFAEPKKQRGFKKKS
ncbi:MAG: type I DNA topoisomerase [Candidatus Zambryskibacteria bacterium]|nr:type I DNA topoisomerase [Candidatus Zambryskibacteria bacterium]